MAFHLGQDIGDMVFIADEGIGGGHSRKMLGEKLLMKVLCSRYMSLHMSSSPQSLPESRHHSLCTYASNWSLFTEFNLS